MRELTRHARGTPEPPALLWVTLALSAAITVVVLVPFAALSVWVLRDVFERPELVLPFAVLAAGYLLLDNTSFNFDAPLVAYRDGRSLWLARMAMSVAMIAGALACAAIGERADRRPRGLHAGVLGGGPRGADGRRAAVDGPAHGPARARLGARAAAQDHLVRRARRPGQLHRGGDRLRRHGDPRRERQPCHDRRLQPRVRALPAGGLAPGLAQPPLLPHHVRAPPPRRPGGDGARAPREHALPRARAGPRRDLAGGERSGRAGALRSGLRRRRHRACDPRGRRRARLLVATRGRRAVGGRPPRCRLVGVRRRGRAEHRAVPAAHPPSWPDGRRAGEPRRLPAVRRGAAAARRRRARARPARDVRRPVRAPARGRVRGPRAPADPAARARRRARLAAPRARPGARPAACCCSARSSAPTESCSSAH